MGVLILLIITIGQRARQAAARQLAAQREVQKEELDSVLQLLEWEEEVVRRDIHAGEEKLRATRLALAHVEDHARRLEAQRNFLLRVLENEQSAGHQTQPVTQLREQLAFLDEQIQALRLELESASGRQGRRYYSVIPYQGPFGTTRWPVYIECRREAIILQPEKIVFTPEDFEGELGPGNPLEAALRAVREYWARHNVGSPEPYPLLLVRPSGIVAYYVARAALEPWGGEFGYELIEEDWDIWYPPANPQLAQYLASVVNQARAQSRALGVAAPRRMAAAARRFVVSPERGGLVPETGAPLAFYGLPRELEIDEGHRSRSAIVDQGGDGRDSMEGGGISHPYLDGTKTAPNLMSSNDSGSGNEVLGETYGAWSMPGRMAAASQGVGPQEGRSGTSGEVGVKSVWSENSSPESANRADPERLPGREQPYPFSVTHSRGLAAQRGVNWAIPATLQVLTPLWRPVRIRCTDQALIFQPERGQRQESVIVWRDPPELTVDELVRQLWQHVESWGPAGKGMAWRPVLRVEVAPGGEVRFQQLLQLLNQSGLTVERVE